MAMSIEEWQMEIHAWAHEKGFYRCACIGPMCEHESGSPTSAIMLIVTELAEAVEALRNRDKRNFAEELADTAIRLFDFAQAMRVNLEDEMRRKMHENQVRPHMHGKAF